MTLKELQERKNKLAAEIRGLADAFNAQGKAWKDGEQRAAWEKVNADYNEVEGQLTAAQDAEAVAQRSAMLAEQEQRASRDRNPALPSGQGESREGQPVTEEVRAAALAAWCRSQLGEELDERQEHACRAVGINPMRRTLTLELDPTHRFRSAQLAYRNAPRNLASDAFLERRAAMSGVSGSTGGALRFDSFVGMLEVNMLHYGGMLQAADVMTTATGERMGWPTFDDTSNTGEQVGENQNVDNSGAGGPVPTTGLVYWDAYDFSSKVIKVPYSLLQDAFVDLPGYLASALGERLGRILNTKCTTGSGAATVKGIITAATNYGDTAGSGAVTFDDVISLEHSVDVAYRTADAGYMCHDSVLAYLRKLKDTGGQYLWQNGISVGQPDRLNGYRLFINNDMASSVSAGNKVLLFGQLSKYKIRRVSGVRFYRLEEAYRSSDQDGFVAFLRADGNLLDAGTAPVKYLTVKS